MHTSLTDPLNHPLITYPTRRLRGIFFCKKITQKDRKQQLLLKSNDPDKNCTIFYCCAAIRSPHVDAGLCFQTKNLSTDGKQVYEIKCIKTLF